jgi:hypothetical protein
MTRSAVGSLYDLNNFVMLGARVPQILKNFTEKSTGQLSIITFGVNTLGCVARIFTSMQEGGAAMVRAYILCESAGGVGVGRVGPGAKTRLGRDKLDRSWVAADVGDRECRRRDGCIGTG